MKEKYIKYIKKIIILGIIITLFCLSFIIINLKKQEKLILLKEIENKKLLIKKEKKEIELNKIIENSIWYKKSKEYEEINKELETKLGFYRDEMINNIKNYNSFLIETKEKNEEQIILFNNKDKSKTKEEKIEEQGKIKGLVYYYKFRAPQIDKEISKNEKLLNLFKQQKEYKKSIFLL